MSWNQSTGNSISWHQIVMCSIPNRNFWNSGGNLLLLIMLLVWSWLCWSLSNQDFT